MVCQLQGCVFETAWLDLSAQHMACLSLSLFGLKQPKHLCAGTRQGLVTATAAARQVLVLDCSSSSLHLQSKGGLSEGSLQQAREAGPCWWTPSFLSMLHEDIQISGLTPAACVVVVCWCLAGHGLGNRMPGIGTGYILAVLTGRLFLLDSTVSQHLEYSLPCVWKVRAWVGTTHAAAAAVLPALQESKLWLGHFTKPACRIAPARHQNASAKVITQLHKGVTM